MRNYELMFQNSHRERSKWSGLLFSLFAKPSRAKVQGMEIIELLTSRLFSGINHVHGGQYVQFRI